jgi:hypothetical protein
VEPNYELGQRAYQVFWEHCEESGACYATWAQLSSANQLAWAKYAVRMTSAEIYKPKG